MGERNGADYLGAGPVYATQTKSTTIEPLGVEGLRSIKEAVCIPVVGIGGINVRNVSEIRRSGVEGISVVSAILGSFDHRPVLQGSYILLGKRKVRLRMQATKKLMFIDFDGTITQRDTCAAMVEAFAGEGWLQINELWEKREISTEECANRTFQLFHATLADLCKLLDTIKIDEGFGAFVDFCREQGYPVYILSDGYDFCIDYILKKYNFNLPYYANHLVYENGFRISCDYFNRNCGLCGTCKRILIESLTDTGSQVIYVGDGISDTCPAKRSSQVFAKGRLLEFCQSEGVPAISMSGFADVLKYLTLHST